MSCDCSHFQKRLPSSRTVRKLLGIPFGSFGSWLLAGSQVRAESCRGAGRLSLRSCGRLVVVDFLFGRLSRTHAHDIQQIVVAQHPRAFGQPLSLFLSVAKLCLQFLCHAKGLAAAS